MSVFLAVVLVALGSLGLVAPLLWRAGRWEGPARWIASTVSPHLLPAAPAAGLFLIATGLTLVWPPAVILAILAGAILVIVLLLSGRRRPVADEMLRDLGEPDHGPETRGQHRRAG